MTAKSSSKVTDKVTSEGEQMFGFAAKIRRAKEHLDALKVSISAFVGEGEAYTIVKKVDREAGEFVFRLKVSRAPPLIDWSLIIGDCLHNTRTALDHVFWALAIRNNPSGIPGNTSTLNFPILKDRSTFNGRKGKLEDWVGPRALTIVERLQPFNDARGSNKNPLMFLHDFDIIDKHQLLLPAISILESGTISAETVGSNRKAIFDGRVDLLEFEDGAEIARLKVRNPEDVVDMNYRVSFEVVFKNQPAPLRVVPTLKRAIEVVEGVTADFAPLL